MRFGILGPLLVDGKNAEAVLPSRTQRAILALLLVNYDSAVSPDRMLEEIWGEALPSSGINTVRYHVSKMREALGSGASIETRPGGYAVGADGTEFDRLDFEQSVRLGLRQRVEEEYEAASTTLRGALEIWRGSPLEEFAGYDFAREAEIQLREQRQNALVNLHDCDLALGAGVEVIDQVTRHLTEYPENDHMRGQLMRAMYRAGRQTEALEVYRRRVETLSERGLDPPGELKSIEYRILIHTLDATPSEFGPVPIPATHDQLFGREPDVNDIVDSLAHRQLVTVTGLGGIGKTRVAIESARQYSASSGSSVAFADLTQVANPESLDSHVAEACGLRQQTGRSSLQALAAHLAANPMLLVLDNCEALPVRDRLPELIRSVLTAAPLSRVLTTSRIPLGIEGEQSMLLGPIDFTQGPIQPTTESSPAAVQLLLDRAELAGVRKRDLGSVVEPYAAAICAAAGGHPLAIELAARQIRATSAEDVLEELRREGASETEDAVARLIDWTYRELAPNEQQLFRRLGVVARGLSLAAALEFGTALGATGVKNQLARLVEVGLIERTNKNGTTRYNFLEPVRKRAHELLDAAEADGVVQAYERTFVRRARELGIQLMNDPRAAKAVAADEDNYTVLMERALNRGDPMAAARIATFLDYYWVFVGKARAGKRWIDRIAASLEGIAASRFDSPRPVAESLVTAAVSRSQGFLASVEREYDEAERLLVEAIDRFDHVEHELRSLTDNASSSGRLRASAVRGGAWARFHLARNLTAKHFSRHGFTAGSDDQDLVDRAAELYQEVERAFGSEPGWASDLAYMLPFAAWNARQHQQGRPEEWFTKALNTAIAHELVVPAGIAHANLAWYCLVDRPSPDEALQHVEESIHTFRTVGDVYSLEIALTIRAIAALQSNNRTLLEDALREALTLMAIQGSREWDYITAGVAAVAMASPQREGLETVVGWLDSTHPNWRELLVAMGVPEASVEFDIGAPTGQHLSPAAVAEVALRSIAA
jgi:predicted ATPase/DNA-binding SARP family transcriptional activator